MTRAPGPQLSVQSDLQLTVGDVHATLVSDGPRLTLHTSDAVALAREAAAVPGVVADSPPLRQVVGRLARALHDVGLAVRVVDDRGTLVEVGAGRRSRVGRVLLRSDHIRPGPVPVLAPAVVRYVASSQRRVAVGVGGLVLAAAAVAIGSRAGRRRGLP